MANPYLAGAQAVIVIVTFSLILITLLTTSIRVGIGIKKHRVLGLDNGMLVAATVSAITSKQSSGTYQRYRLTHCLTDSGVRTEYLDRKRRQFRPWSAHGYTQQLSNRAVLAVQLYC